tara:strand:+ start:3882 stop:5666 length:1785 start_codon:yes stop_codon:yes gene_type:complete
MRVGDLVVDLEKRVVRRSSTQLDLPDRSFRLLEALIRRAPDEVSKDRLIREVWDDAVVSDETLAQRVRLLRQSLGDDSQNPRYIASVRGRGYRLIAEPCEPVSIPEHHRGIAKWLVVAAVTLFGLALAWQITQKPAPVDKRPETLAVLPFADLSADGDHQFFADGMHEELLSRLATIDGLSVISRTSVERYRDTEVSLPAVGAELGATAIIEGSIRVDGDRLRVTVQFIDATTDEHVWAKSFDRQLSVQDIFDLQTEVANEIAEALQVQGQGKAIRNVGLPTNSIEAYNLYLLGRYHTLKQSTLDLERAVEFLQQAIDIDPEFAGAYAWLGWAYSFLGAEYGTYRPTEMYPLAKAAALHAIALDADLADARTLYAATLTWYDWDFEAAEREYLKAVELDPMNVLGYAVFLSARERHDEAIAMVERRLAAEPGNPFVLVNAGWRYLHAGLTDKAIAAGEAAAKHHDSAILIGLSRLAEGDPEAAIAVFEEAIRSQGRSPLNVRFLAVANYRDGRQAQGDALLSELEGYAAENYLSPALFAHVYFAAGDADRGFAALEEAFEERSREMIFLRVTELLRGYRDDPRYLDLVARVERQ